MWLPSGYKNPFLVYLVVTINEEDGSSCQFGGFATEREAVACVTRLESEGRRDLYINTVAIRERLTDWQWDR